MINCFTHLLSWIVIKAFEVFKKNSEIRTRQEGRINVKGEKFEAEKFYEFYQFLNEDEETFQLAISPRAKAF